MRARVKSLLFVNYLTFNYLFARVWKSGYFACQPVKPYPSLRFLHPNLLPTKQALYAAKLGLERRKQGFGWSHVVSGFYRQKPPGTLRYGYPVSTEPYLCSVKP